MKNDKKPDVEQELITPEATPRMSGQAMSPIGGLLAATGVTLMTLCLLGSAAAATVWALCKLMGLPDFLLYFFLAVAAVPVIWATLWTGGRARHVEQRLARHQDIDTPVFATLHYLRRDR